MGRDGQTTVFQVQYDKGASSFQQAVYVRP